MYNQEFTIEGLKVVNPIDILEIKKESSKFKKTGEFYALIADKIKKDNPNLYEFNIHQLNCAIEGIKLEESPIPYGDTISFYSYITLGSLLTPYFLLGGLEKKNLPIVSKNVCKDLQSEYLCFYQSFKTEEEFNNHAGDQNKKFLIRIQSENPWLLRATLSFYNQLPKDKMGVFHGLHSLSSYYELLRRQACINRNIPFGEEYSHLN